MKPPIFLTLDEVLAIHAQQIRDYGGAAGVRDMGGALSAIAMPQQTFGGAFVHGDLMEMAAAYLFHICKNRPFVDGNKRVGLAAALIFLDMNGFELHATPDDVVALVEAVAGGSTGKAAVAVFFAQHVKARR